MEGITSFSEWVRRQRNAMDMTQAQLAAQVGCALITIRKIEQELRRPSRQMAELLADVLAIPATQRDLFLRMARHEYIDTNIISRSGIDSPPMANAIDKASTLAPFVARERELVQLKAHLTSALNGSGRIVFVAGEAGYGKTTLMVEFARYALTLYPDLIVAGGNCEAYDGTGEPYLPFREIMALLAGDIESSSQTSLLSNEQARRLWALLPHTTHALVDHGPDLINVLVSGDGLLQRAMSPSSAGESWRAKLEMLMQRKGPPGNLRQRQIFEQYVQVLHALAKRQPLLLLLDDLHWLDHTSAGLLLYMATARRLAGSRILVLGSYRPSEVQAGRFGEEQKEAHPLVPVLDEIKRYYGDVELDLGKQAPQMARAFVDALLDSEPNQLEESFRAALYQRTGGHPLFTVELLRDMQERSALVQDGEGRWIEGGAIEWETLPTRVEAVINQRISRLPAMLQEALKVASVEGETFTAEVVAQLVGIEKWQMVKHFSSVVDRQHHLVASQGSQRLGGQLLSRYRFGHILFQAYLYDSLDAAERAYLHEAVGHTVEQLAAGHTEAVAVQLAHHFQSAGLWTKAIDYLRQAGERAVAMSAHQEAIAHFSRALTLLEGQPDTEERARLELRLQTDLGVSLKATKGFAALEVEKVYRRAQALCEQVGEPLQWATVFYGLNGVYVVRGEPAMGLEFAQRCHDLAQAQGEPVLHVTGHSVLGQSHVPIGHLRLARSHLEQAIAAYSVQQHDAYIFLDGIDVGVFSLAQLAHILWYLGYPDQALEQGQKAVTLAHSLSNPFGQASALSYLTMLYQFRRDWHAVQSTAQAAIQLCIEQDFPYYLAWSTLMQGWALTEQDQVERGIVQMEQGLADLQATGAGLRRPYYLGLLAEAYGKAGRIEDGLRLLADALVQAQEQEQRLYETELYRVQGELLRAQGATGETVEKCFHQAIALAQQQEAKSTELRATTGLTRLWQSQGKHPQARQLLAEVYDWFTEGLETPDLREAKSLLETLTEA
jgi:adenylate cyclase